MLFFVIFGGAGKWGQHATGSYRKYRNGTKYCTHPIRLGISILQRPFTTIALAFYVKEHQMNLNQPNQVLCDQLLK